MAETKKHVCGINIKAAPILGAPWSLRGSWRVLRWCENPADIGLRLVGYSDDMTHARHEGWYVDTFQDATTRGVVYRLPHSRGFIAGCTDPHNDGAAVLDMSIETDERDAARSAESLAEYYAEECRTDDEAFQAGQDAAQAAEDARNLGREILTLLKDARPFRKRADAPQSLCNRLQADIERMLEERAELRDKVETLCRDWRGNENFDDSFANGAAA